MLARCRRSRPHRVAWILATLIMLLSPAACDSDPTDPRPAVDLEPFQELARGAPCANLRNRLFLVDSRSVFSDRSGSCVDYAYSQTLYGLTPDEVLCYHHDSIGGPMMSCPDERFRDMFNTILANSDRPDLGLGPFHRVEPIPF